MDPQEIDIQMDELENRLDRLRALYEQYFLGIEKIEPAVARKDVDRRFWMLRKVQIRNTARRFRLQVIIQRYNTFQQYWARICREIENGTYVRHLLKAQKNVGYEPKTWAARKRLGLLNRGDPDVPANGPEAGAADLAAVHESSSDPALEAQRAVAQAHQHAERTQPAKGATVTRKFEDLGPLDLDFDDEPNARRSARPAPSGATKLAPPGSAAPPSIPGTRPRSPAAPAAQTAAGASGLTDDGVKRLHAQLVASRRQMNQPDNVSLDSFAKSLRDTESKLLAQHKGRSVEFQVVVKDGKPVVKPVVRK